LGHRLFISPFAAIVTIIAIQMQGESHLKAAKSLLRRFAKMQNSHYY